MAKKKQVKPAAPGLDIPINEYHADTSRISKSGLDSIHESPADYHYHYLDPTRKPEPVKEWSATGNMVGEALLTPDIWATTNVVLDDSEICFEIAGIKNWQEKGKRPRTTARYEEWLKLMKETELKGKTLLLQDQYDQITAMRDSLRRHRIIKAMLASGWAERTFYFTDPETGVDCRIRPDWIADALEYLFDCKTTVSANPKRFGSSAYKFRYHVQDPFYTDGMKHHGFNSQGFVLGCVEKHPPYKSAAYIIPPHVTELGRQEYKADLRAYAEAKASGIWKGYDQENVQTLEFPEWALPRRSAGGIYL